MGKRETPLAYRKVTLEQSILSTGIKVHGYIPCKREPGEFVRNIDSRSIGYKYILHVYISKI